MQKIKILLRITLLACATSLLCACALFTDPPKKEIDPRGYGSKHNVEAEKAFAFGHSTWGKKDKSSNPEKAIELFTQAIKIEPDYTAAYLWRGVAYSELSHWEEAFEDLTKAIRLEPTAVHYAYRGLVSMRGGNAMGARKDLDESIALDSSQYKAYNFRGALEILLENSEAACKDFDQGCSNGDCTGYESAKAQGYCK